jgi:hypothetical protein
MIHAILLIISRLLLYLDAIRDCTLKLLYSMRSGFKAGKALFAESVVDGPDSGSRSRARQLPAPRAVSPVTPATARRRMALLEYLLRDSPSLRANGHPSAYYTMFADSNNNATMFLTAIFNWR